MHTKVKIHERIYDWVSNNKKGVKVGLLSVGSVFILISIWITTAEIGKIDVQLNAIEIDAILNAQFYGVSQQFILAAKSVDNQRAILEDINPGSLEIKNMDAQEKSNLIASLFHLWTWAEGTKPPIEQTNRWSNMSNSELRSEYVIRGGQVQDCREVNNLGLQQEYLSAEWKKLNNDKNELEQKALAFQAFGIITSLAVAALEVIWKEN
ncbi:MAG: hypothetical protein WC506_04565 [Candidatus Micrarchaeia archaeon]